MTDPEPADLNIEPPRPSFWRNLSFVWLVPVLALAVSLGLAWQTYSDRGVLIDITFPSASGVVPGETTVRFRDVSVGTVEDVSFTEDLSRVKVTARIDKTMAQFIDADAQFWIVSPKVSARGISGLSTVLSGVYIEAAWDQSIGPPARRFEGLENPPLVQPGRAGKRITLISDDGRLLSDGAPVFFHGIEVGRLERPRLTVSTDMIVVDAFIEAPHDRRLNTATRFWDTSGLEVSIGGSGLNVKFESLAALVAGGVAFDSIYEGGTPVSPGHVFTVFPSEAEARKSLFVRAPVEAVQIAAEFGESVSGLEAGADVRYGGLKVGEVTAISAHIEETEFGPEIRPMARLSIEPDKLGLPRDAGTEGVLDFLDAAVQRGLRAQLAAKNLFSGALVVELVEIEDAPAATFDRDAEPLPILPSHVSNLPDFTATAEGLFERINNLPIEEVLNQAISTMASIEEIARRDSTLSLTDNAAALLDDTRALINDAATRALPSQIEGAVAEIREVVSGLRGEDGVMAQLRLALEQANAAIANVATASEEFPALVADLRDVAAKANALNAEELVAAATRVMESADALIGSEETRQLPSNLNASLEQVRTALEELREGGVVENANAAMASARDAAAAVEAAAEGLPELSARLDDLVRQAEGLMAAYGDRSAFNEESLSALREVRSAARAVSQLARAIERDPASLIRGR